MDRALADMNFLDRVQSAFAPEDMTQDRLEEWLIHSKGKHLVSKGTRRGKTRYEEVTPKGILPQSVRLARKLSETEEVFEEVEISKDVRELQRLRDRVDELYVHKKTIITKTEIKIKEIRREELVRKGKRTTLYRDDLKEATSEAELDRILGNAFEELGEGKNYDSLVASADILRERLI